MANGNFGGGDGSYANPLIIEDPDDLYAIRYGLSKSYKLANSIDLGVAPYNQGLGWVPIPGTFTGYFDGNGKKVMNLFINRQDQDYVGLFSHTYYYPNFLSGTSGPGISSQFKNFAIENANIKGRNYVGMITGYAGCSHSNYTYQDKDQQLLDRCYVSGQVTGVSNLGGFIGQLYVSSNGSYWTGFSDCFTDVTINSLTNSQYYGLYIGSIYGNSNYLYFQYCIANGKFTSVTGTPAAYPFSIRLDGYTSQYFNQTGCYYNTDSWNGSPDTLMSAQGKPKSWLAKRNNMPTFDVRRMDNGLATWTWHEGDFPRIWFANQNAMFVKADDKYYVYDSDNDVWKQTNAAMPTRKQALINGMKTLDNIPRSAWKTLRDAHTSIDIINIIEKSAGVTQSDQTISLGTDSARNTAKKIFFKQTINCANYGDSIMKMEPL